MYRTVLLILYLLVLIPSITILICRRESPVSRRLSAGLGIAGVLLAPELAVVLCELIVSLVYIGIFFFVVLFGIGLMFSALFR